MEAKKQHVRELIDALSPDVEEQLNITWKNVRKGMVVGAMFTGVFALLIGPAGLAVGGIIGGLFSWKTSQKFKPLPQILMEMTPAQKNELFESILQVLGGLVWDTATQLILKVNKTPCVKDAVINVIIQKLFS